MCLKSHTFVVSHFLVGQELMWLSWVSRSGSVTGLWSGGWTHVSAHSGVVGRSRLLTGCWAKGLSFSWLLVEGHPPLHVAWSRPPGTSQHGNYLD